MRFFKHFLTFTEKTMGNKTLVNPKDYESVIHDATSSMFRGEKVHDIFYKIHRAFRDEIGPEGDPSSHPSTKGLYTACCDVYGQPLNQDELLELNSFVSGNY